MLAALVELAERLHLPPPHYAPRPVRWRIELDASGTFLGFVEMRGAQDRPGRGGAQERGLTMLVPYRRRTSAIKPSLLVEDGRYVFGWATKPTQRRRARAAREAFLTLVRACFEATQEPAVGACLTFLERHAGRVAPPQGWRPEDLFTFSVDGSLPTERPSVQHFWASAALVEDAADLVVLPCSDCGRQGPVLSRLPIPLRGVPGGPPGGTALVSANSPAYESYGLQASTGAALCARCAERSHQALNALLAGEAGARIRVGGLVYVSWTARPEEFNPLRLLSAPSAEDVAALVRAVHSGQAGAVAISPADYYALALGASRARAVLHDTLESTVETVRRHVARFFQLQRVVDEWDRGPGRPLGVETLAASTARNGDEPRAQLVVALVRLALDGRPLPPACLEMAVRRARQEQRLTYPRVALMKLALVSLLASDPGGEEEYLVDLDEARRDAPYVCGRLLAVLESLQRAAQPRIRQTLVDRFYGSASTAPASVFGTLLRQAQAHLSKLRRDNPAAFAALAERLESVQSLLDGFPATLTLQEQARFALGYWHQRAADRAAARAHRLAASEPPALTEPDETEGTGDAV